MLCPVSKNSLYLVSNFCPKAPFIVYCGANSEWDLLVACYGKLFVVNAATEVEFGYD